jgi:histone-lysine N-methyltransferase SETMAR
MLTKGIVLLHNNMPNTAACTNALIKLFIWEIFDHPPYSPDLVPSDYRLFTKMKVWLATQYFHTNKDLAAPFFDGGLQKLVPWYKKCLNVGGKYVEK